MKSCGLVVAGAIAALGPLGFIISVVQAQTPQSAQIARGAAIAAQGTPTGVPPCAQCHAFNGVSDASGAFPRIAGQSAYYLAQELRDFASGVRANAFMTPIAKALTSDEMFDVAAYYAGIGAPFLPLRKPDEALVKAGELLAKIGDERRRIQACDNCHGSSGAGEPPALPYLAGQYASYIAFELRMWQRGFRKNSADEMAVVAKGLDDREIAAVAGSRLRSPRKAPRPVQHTPGVARRAVSL
jgi:cytochrome c553